MSDVDSILASFCVWTKSLKCKDAVNRDSTIQNDVRRFCLQVRRISSSLSTVRTIEPSRQDAHLSTVPSVRTTCLPSGPPRQISIIRTDEVFIPSGPHTVSKRFCASLHPSGRFSSTSGCLSVLDQFLISFQVPRKGRSIHRPDDVVSRLDVRLLKARIAIQISPSGCLTAMVRTRVHQRRKLPIRLQPSGRLPIMVRTRALQIQKLCVEE
jgi:hypothetical protein